MKEYKRIIKSRLFLLSVLALLAVGLGIYDVFFATMEMKASDVFNFQCGITTGLGVLALVSIMRYHKALRSEKELQKQYIKENDERMTVIRGKAGMPVVFIYSIIMIIVGIISGYFNKIVFITLIVIAVIQLLISCAIKMIYMKKL